MGGKAWNGFQEQKNVQRVPTVEYSWGMSLFSLASSNWVLGQKKQLFLFLKYGSLTKRKSKTWDISRRCPQPAGKLSWFEKLARSHGWAARERSACSLRVLSQLVLLARNGELARRLTYPIISGLPGKKSAPICAENDIPAQFISGQHWCFKAEEFRTHCGLFSVRPLLRRKRITDNFYAMSTLYRIVFAPAPTHNG